ncbi:MAG: filamentous hemagglutinin N-terminal domain-containing protein, partial [Actinomyces sp.]
MSSIRRRLRATTSHPSPRLGRLVALCLLAGLGRAEAGPEGGNVVAGDANIVQNGATTTVRQLSDRAIINWRSMDVGANEALRFEQPNAAAIALNRIAGARPTSILGQLTANGRVFIVNPNGVFFGSSARVDVAGLLATTFDIRDADFMAGRDLFEQQSGAAAGLVVNQGEIRISENGFAFLVAPGVANRGLIVARLGKVVLASGDRLTLDFRGDGLLTYSVSGKVLESVRGPDGQPIDAAVSNQGRISAEGGHVLLSGDAADGVFASVVNNEGIIEARSLVRRGGRVILSAGAEGIARNDGTVDASAAEAGAAGGEVRISGRGAGNFGTILARGSDAAGGTVRLDSGQRTIASAESLIDVSGQGDASGGQVFLRSGGHTTFAGTVLARGGALGGDGGFVDASGDAQVDVLGRVDATAPQGALGTFLIDPKFLVVASAGGASYDGMNNTFADNPTGTTTLTPASLDTGANIILQANTDVTITDPISLTTANATLTVQAGRSVLVNANITTNDGAVSITANDPAAQSANRDAGAGSIVMAAGTTIAAGAGDVTLTIDPGAVAPFQPGTVAVNTITTTGNVTVSSVGEITQVSGGSGIGGATLTLSATAANAGIGATGPALSVSPTARVDATTNNGHVSLATTGDLPLGTLNAGTGTVLLTVTDGNITDAAAGVGPSNITSGPVNFVLQASDPAAIVPGAIGTAALPIRTTIGTLTASTQDGGIYIAEADGMLVNSVVAREGGNTPGPDAAGNILVGGVAGTHDVVLTSTTSDISLQTVQAPDVLAVTASAGQISDGNGAALNLTARTLTLTASGAIADPNAPLQIQVMTATASSTGGGVALQETNALDLTSIAAAGPVKVTLDAGSLSVGTVNAAGQSVVLAADQGSITDANGGAVNVTADALDLSAKSGLFSAADPLETALATSLKTRITDAGVGTYIANTGTLATLDATTNDGDVSVTYTGGSTGFTASTDLLNAGGLTGLSFQNTGGGLAVGTVNVGTAAGNAVSLTAGGGVIADDANDAASDIVADSATLTASTAVGAAGNTLDTSVATLTATAQSGGVFVDEANGLVLTATATGAGNDVSVAALAGNLAVESVSAPDQVTLSAAAGAVTANTPANTAIVAAAATLSAGQNIGASAAPLKTQLGALTATASGGGLFLDNTGDLTLASATATGAALTLNNTGNVALGSLSASGQTVTLSATGQVTDNNGAATNVTATTAVLGGAALGADADRLESSVSDLTATASAGGVFVANAGAGTLTLTAATAVGPAGADVKVSNAGNIVLHTATAKGDAVVLDATGATATITDGNDPPTGTLNVDASNFTATALGGIGTSGNPIETTVDTVSLNGGSNGAFVVNLSDLRLDAATIQGGGTIQGKSITVDDLGGVVTTVSGGKSLTLRTQAGNIVFLNQSDTLAVTGSGTITVEAGLTVGSGAVAVIGNLRTEGGTISVLADGHVTVGLLDAQGSSGAPGDVSITSRSGIILDGNGVANNVIARNLTLSGTTPSAADALLNTTQAIADASAAVAQAAAQQTTLDAFTAAQAITAAAIPVAQATLNSATASVAAAQADVSAKQSTVNSLSTALTVAEATSLALGIAAQIAEGIAAPAQAIPFTGDGGAATAAFVAQSAALAADAVALALSKSLDAAQNDLQDAQSALLSAQAQEFAAKQDLVLAQTNNTAMQEAVTVAQADVTQSNLVRDSLAVVRDQAIAAEQAANVVGTATQPFGVQTTGTTTIAAGESSVYLESTGSVTLGNVSASKTDATADVDVSATGTITVAGAVSAQRRIRFDNSATAGADVLQGAGGSLSAAELVIRANDAVGTGATPLQSSVDRFAASAGGGVFLQNSKALRVDTVDGLAGISTSGGGVGLATTAGDLTLAEAIDASAGAQTVSLTAAGAIVDAHAAGDDVSANGLALDSGTGVGTAGDPLETAVSNLEARASASGGIYLSNTAASLTVGGVSGLTGISTAAAATVDLDTSGALTVSEAIATADGGTVDLDAAGTVTLSVGAVSAGASGTASIATSAGNIVGAAGGANATAGTLTLTASQAGATLGSAGTALEVDAGALTASTGAAGAPGGLLNLLDTAGGLTVQSATTNGGNVALDLATASGDLTVAGAVASAGAVALASNNDSGAAHELRLKAGSSVQSSGGAVALSSGDDVVTESGSTLSAAGPLTITADRPGDGSADGTSGVVRLGGTATGAGASIAGAGFELTGTLTSTGAVDATVVSTASSPVDGIRLGGSLAAAGQTVTLSATGLATTSILDANGASPNITAARLGAAATAGVGTSADPLETTLGSLAATGGTGGVFVQNTGNLTLETVGGVSALSATAGGIELTTSGALAIRDGFVSAPGQAVALTASGGSITETAPGAAADVVGANVSLTVGGATSTIGTDAANRLEVDATAQLDATTAGGSIYLTDTAGGAPLGLLTTGGAAGSEVVLDATNGSITDALGDAAADLVAETVRLTAAGAGSIGTAATAAGRVQVDASVLDATTSGGDAYLEDVSGGLGVGLVTTGGTGAGLVDLLVRGGSLTDAAGDAAADVVGQTVTLSVTGAGSAIGAGTSTPDRLQVDAGVLNVATAGGAAYLEDTAGGVQAGLLSTTQAAGSLLDLRSAGSITSAAVDGTADLVSEHVVLETTSAGASIGTAGARLELDAVVLDATTNGGDIYANDLAGGVATGLVTSGGLAGTVDLFATNGSIIEARPADPDADIVGDVVNLRVTGPTSTIGEPTEFLEVSANVLGNIQTDGGGVFLSTTPIAGDLFVDSINNPGGTLRLVVNGSIREAAPSDPTPDIVVGTLDLQVLGGASTIGTAADPIEIDVQTLSASTQGGGIWLTDTAGGVAVARLDTTQAPGASITLVAQNGSITEASPSDADADLVTHALDLRVTGAGSTIGTIGDAIEIDAVTLDLTTQGGNATLHDLAGGIAVGSASTLGAPGNTLTLRASGGSITSAAVDGAPDLLAENLNLSVTGAGALGAGAGARLEVDVTTLNATSEGGDIHLLDTSGDLFVNYASSGSTSAGTVDLQTVAGRILEAGADAPADVVGQQVVLTAGGAASSLGSSTATLEVDAANFDGNAGTGGIWLADTAGGIALGSVATTGDLALDVQGG